MRHLLQLVGDQHQLAHIVAFWGLIFLHRHHHMTPWQIKEKNGEKISETTKSKTSGREKEGSLYWGHVRMDGSVHLSIIQWLLHQQGMILSKLTSLQEQRRGRKQNGQGIEAMRREGMTGYWTKGVVICELKLFIIWTGYKIGKSIHSEKKQMVWGRIGSSCLVLFLDRVKATNNAFIKPAKPKK